MAEKVCSLCEGTGWVLVATGGKSVARRCDCFYERKTQALWEQARIPRRYQNCSLGNFEVHNDSHKDALKISRKFVGNYPAQEIGLLFIGPCGVGKTHLAVAILKLVIREKGARGLFYDTRELLRVIRSTYNPLVQTAEMDVLRPVMEADLLVLDDLGAEKTSEWVEETLNLIVNTRYNERRATIFTSNYLRPEDVSKDPAEDSFKAETLQERVGERMWSRLHEMCDFVTMVTVDFRMAGPDATAEDLARLDKHVRPQASRLPARTKGPARAQLRDKGDLKWSGGKAGR